ncbi:MAG: hypothetical protein A2X94_01510 [Bdellovibrionales bacterium GWB1_55_8]|nr:MAG: hypothetical protein A2X94_01510 [Bdellovibrionales bacterium GWB1_55_8]
MNIFSYSDYRKVIRDSLSGRPRKGYGQLSRLAESMGVNATFISQVLSAAKAFSPEQGVVVAEFLGFTELEAEYFVLLVQIERAGSLKLRRIHEKRQRELQKQSKDLLHRLTPDQVLSEEQKAIFYSDWHYSAVRQMTAIPGFDTPDAIGERLSIPISLVREILSFLVKSGLCIQKSRGRFSVGPSRTHLEGGSPWVKVHHQNWRARAIEDVNQPEDGIRLHYSSPMTVSREDALKIRAMAVQLIDDVGKSVRKTHSEELLCLNVDWFRVQ